MNKPFQRKGSISNAHVDHTFEAVAKAFFSNTDLELNLDLKVPIGVGSVKKDHVFDLGCPDQEVIVECKSHRWTSSVKYLAQNSRFGMKRCITSRLRWTRTEKSCLYSKM